MAHRTLRRAPSAQECLAISSDPIGSYGRDGGRGRYRGCLGAEHLPLGAPLKYLKPVADGPHLGDLTPPKQLIRLHPPETCARRSRGEIPKVLKNATISIEDKDFWKARALDAAVIASRLLEDRSRASRWQAPLRSPALVLNLYIRHPEDTSTTIRKRHWRPESLRKHRAARSSTPT